MTTVKKRSRRAKYITLYSPFLMRETKHELIGEPIETETGRHQWARCTRSRHSQLINIDAIEAEADRSNAIVPISREEARRYSPKEEYQIGDVIYHAVWDDVGIVRSKNVMSNGGKAIVVHFEKNNEKTLVENLK